MNNPKKVALQKSDNKLERVSLAESRNIMYEKFRINIRLLRAKTGLSGCEAGEKVGLKNGKRMIDLEYGRGTPDMEEIILISRYFNVSIGDLIEKEAQVTF